MDLRHHLAGLRWHLCTAELRNLRNTFAREHPLFIFQAISNHAARAAGLEPTRDLFFHPDSLLEQGATIHRGTSYRLTYVFPRLEPVAIDRFRHALATHLADPAHNFELLATSAPRPRRLDDLLAEQSDLAGAEELCLDFLTPLPFTPKDKKRDWLLDPAALLELLRRRLQRFYDLDLPDLAPLAADLRLLPYYWELFTRTHDSKSTGQRQQLIGRIGPLYLRGALGPLLPLLLVCQELHAGRRIANGQGHYRLLRERPFFDPHLDDLPGFCETMAETCRQSDIAREIDETSLDREALYADLQRELAAGRLRARPARGLHVPKRRGGDRLIATLAPEDYLAHKFLQRRLAPVLDRMFEESSVGFRPHRSREEAGRMIRRLCDEGFCHVLESDIAAFFDQVDWDILTARLADHLPLADRRTLALLRQVIETPLELAGKPLPRERGLLQGSPLSPLLANLYLDALDEAVRARGYQLIRYADDFLVLTRGPEEAQQAWRDIRDILAGLKLELKEEKTRVAPVDLGFSFLGLSFGPGMDEDYINNASASKTLFVRSEFVFLGLDYDSLIVRRGGQLLERLPLRQISEIVVLGANTVSTALLHRCGKDNIPVSFCSAAGYYHTTLRPDSRRHFILAGKHLQRFTTLTPEDLVTLAARIVSAKLHNYLSWFSERWPSEADETRHELETAIAAVSKAVSIEAIRGFEGLAARHVFRFVNDRCADEAFRAGGRRKREKQDRFNSLLDFAYFLLFTRLNVLVRGRGLNPYLGVLHSHKDNYESLVCDLQEPFRCRMDRFVLKLLNRAVIRPEHFHQDGEGRYSLEGPAVGLVLEHFEREMDTRLSRDGGTLKQTLIAQVHAVEQWVHDGGELKLFRAG
ncbi:MAG: CRISPR-associated endonuclease Cas1 [Desulfobulbaceae bacterium A2]|nr:MAG: CRISPR-associated endonuclease Cas1 [Desulfobulbaceae bacterium A2]